MTLAFSMIQATPILTGMSCVLILRQLDCFTHPLSVPHALGCAHFLFIYFFMF